MAGDKHAEYTAFVENASPRLFRTAYALTGSYAEAEDLLQTALTKVYTSWSRVVRASTPEAYVRRTLVNQLISWHRRSGRRPEMITSAPPDVSLASHGDTLTESAAMWAALAGLAPRQRAVVVLRFYEDLSERDIAEALGVAPGTVKSQCSAALRSLQAALDTAATDR